MAKIFISYRRDDSEYQTDRLHRELSRFVDSPKDDIFIDIDNIPYGIAFADYIEQNIANCEVLLAVIGRSWLEVKDPSTGAQRLSNPGDFVRVEIAAALRRGIPVVPVLLDKAEVPKPDQLPEDLRELSGRSGIVLNRASFAADVEKLVRGLPVTLNEGGGQAEANMVRDQPQSAQSQQDEPANSVVSFIAASLFVVAIVVAGATLLGSPSSDLQETIDNSPGARAFDEVAWVHVGTVVGEEWTQLKFELSGNASGGVMPTKPSALRGKHLILSQATGTVNVRSGDAEKSADRARAGVDRPVIDVLKPGETVLVRDALRLIDGSERQVWVRIDSASDN